MTPAVLVWVWGITFFVAAIPGAIVGWIVGALFGSTAGSMISLAISVAASLMVAHKFFPGVDIIQIENVIMFTPPFLVAALLGVWISTLTSKAQRHRQQRPS